MSTATFPKFLMGFVPINRMKVRTKFELRIALHVPEIIAIEVLGGGGEPPILGKRRP